MTTVSVAGDRYRFLVTGEQTGNAYAMFDFHVPPDHGPPPHRHSREDEAFYILEGEFEFTVAGQAHRAGPREVVFAERGIVHSFRCVSATAGHMIVTVSPAGMEKFFEEVGTPLPGPNAEPVPPSPEELQRMLSVASRYGLEILPPPHTERRPRPA